MAAQQRRFDRWQYLRNQVRPHEALGMLTPAQIYHRSPRRLHDNDTAMRYPKGWLVRRASATGHLWHDGHHYHLGEIFAHCRVGLRQDAAGRTELHFANVHLGYLVFDPAERFRPPAYIAPPDRKSLAKSTLKTKPKV